MDDLDFMYTWGYPKMDGLHWKIVHIKMDDLGVPLGVDTILSAWL